MGIGNRTNSDIDDRTERECVARGRVAARNRGDIPLRWVDVMPQVSGPSLIDEAKRERAALDKAKRHVVVAAPAFKMSEEERERHRRNNRAAWERKKARMGTKESRAAEREEQRRRTRTPLQQERHDYYVAMKAKRKVES